MQVRDESLWQESVKDLLETEHGTVFYDFVKAWAEVAENVIAQDGTEANPAEALRITLDHIENIYERKAVWILGQCLVFLCMHWVYGEKLAEGFTEFEMRLVQDITAAKIAQLQVQAEEVSVPE